MANQTRWYTTREALKVAADIKGSDLDARLDFYIQAASADIEVWFGRRFIPYIDTKILMPKSGRYRIGFYYPDWAESENPWLYGGSSRFLALDDELLSVTSIKIDESRDGSFTAETALASTDYELLPRNESPKSQIQLTDYGTRFSFPRGVRVQVVGIWGHSADTAAAGKLTADLTDTTGTAVAVSDASKVGVGDTLLVDDEQMFVSDRTPADTTATLAANLTAAVNDVTVSVDGGSKVNQGEVILIDSEKMFVIAVSGNDLTVQRAYDATVLASHTGTPSVYAYRALTVVRGVNGTTAATHATDTLIDRYVPPADISLLCQAQAVGYREGFRAGWTAQMGGAEGTIIFNAISLKKMKDDCDAKYGGTTVGVQF